MQDTAQSQKSETKIEGSDLPCYLVQVDEVRKICNPDNESPHPFVRIVHTLRKDICERLKAMEFGYKEIAENANLVKTLQGRTFSIEEVKSVELLILGTEAEWFLVADSNGDVSLELRWNKNQKNRRRYTIPESMTDSDIESCRMPIDPMRNLLRRWLFIPVCLSTRISKAETKICDSLTLASEHALDLAREARKDLNASIADLNDEVLRKKELKRELASAKRKASVEVEEC